MSADAILAIIPTSPPEGWRLVPVAITPEMARALESNFAECVPASEVHRANWAEAWINCLAASPSPTLGVGERGWPTREEVASAIETVLFMRASTTDLDGYIIQTSRDCAEAALALFPPPPQTGDPA